MEAKKAKPYYIELYNTSTNTLKNKFKFVLEVKTVKELKELIKEKLIAKNEFDKDTTFAIKDADDFELASDDEIDDVVPDAKVRVYPKVSGSSPIIPPQPPVQVSAPVAVQNSQSPPPQAPVAVLKNNDLVSKNTILDLKNLSIPILGPETKYKMHLYCPQIRKTVIELTFDEKIDSYLDLSRHIVHSLGL